MSKIASCIATGLKNRMADSDKVASIIAASVLDAVQEAVPSMETPVGEMSADKQAYYLALALRDVKMVIDAANFNLGNLITIGKPVVNNMFFNRDGSAEVDATLPLEIEPQEDYTKVTEAFDLKMRSEFEAFVTYNISLPSIAKPTASASLNLRIPSSLMTNIGADKFDTRSKVLQKYIDGMFKKELS